MKKNRTAFFILLFLVSGCDVYDKKEILNIAEERINGMESSFLIIEEIAMDFLKEVDTLNTVEFRPFARKHTLEVYSLKKDGKGILDPHREELSEEVRERLFQLMKTADVESLLMRYSNYMKMNMAYRNSSFNNISFIHAPKEELITELPIYTSKESVPDSPGWYYQVKDGWYVLSPK